MRMFGKSLLGGALLFCLFVAIIPAYALFSAHVKRTPPAPSKRSMLLSLPSSGKSADSTAVASGKGSVLLQEVRLSVAELTIDVGYMEQLMFTISPSGAAEGALRWFSDDESVATVDASGLICGVSAGTANITATLGDRGRSAACKVTVVDMETGGEGGCATSSGLAFCLLPLSLLVSRRRGAL